MVSRKGPSKRRASKGKTRKSWPRVDEETRKFMHKISKLEENAEDWEQKAREGATKETRERYSKKLVNNKISKLIKELNKSLISNAIIEDMGINRAYEDGIGIDYLSEPDRSRIIRVLGNIENIEEAVEGIKGMLILANFDRELVHKHMEKSANLELMMIWKRMLKLEGPDGKLDKSRLDKRHIRELIKTRLDEIKRAKTIEDLQTTIDKIIRKEGVTYDELVYHLKGLGLDLEKKWEKLNKKKPGYIQ